MDRTQSYAPAIEIPALFGSEGELVLVRIAVEPRHLEDLLESLAALDFPLNPELIHTSGTVLVEFPAYESHVHEVRKAVEDSGVEVGSLEINGILLAPAAHV